MAASDPTAASIPTPARPAPHAPLLNFRTEVLNQDHEVVLTMQGWNMFGRRPATSGGAA